MSVKRERAQVQTSFADLVGKPAFQKTEDASEYATLRAEIGREINPQNIFDEMRVKDITDSVWEENRLKRQQTALIQGARTQSLAFLLAPHYGDGLEAALETAQGYFSGNPKKIGLALELIQKLGITDEQIEANAVHVRGPSFQMLDRMIFGRAVMRNRHIKDHERRQRKKAKKEKRRIPINDNEQ